MGGGHWRARNPGWFLGWRRGSSSLQDAPQFGPSRQAGSMVLRYEGVGEVPGALGKEAAVGPWEAVGENSRKFQGGADM